MGAKQLEQTLNRNSQADQQEGTSFASSFVEDNRDSGGRGLEERGSGNTVEDSGVAFPFLDRATQEKDQFEEFRGDNQEGNLNQESNFGDNKKADGEGESNMGGSLG